MTDPTPEPDEKAFALAEALRAPLQQAMKEMASLVATTYDARRDALKLLQELLNDRITSADPEDPSKRILVPNDPKTRMEAAKTILKHSTDIAAIKKDLVKIAQDTIAEERRRQDEREKREVETIPKPNARLAVSIRNGLAEVGSDDDAA